MKIMYMGTPDFAAYILEKLVSDGYNVASVVTKVDAQKGRGQKIRFSAVKETALNHNLTVYQPETLKDNAFMEVLEAEKPDMIVVVAYGKILPSYILSYPKYGCINVHASLLPKFRGSAPIQYAVLKGEKESGVTTMLMADGIDTGDMLVKKSVSIDSDETGGSLHDKLMVLGYEALKETIENIETIKPEPQDESLMTYAPPIKKEETVIDFSENAEDIINRIKGFYPFPGTSFILNGNSYKIHKAEICSDKDCGCYGEVEEFTKNGLKIKAKGGIINILEIQPAGKKKMSIADFYNGNKI